MSKRLLKSQSKDQIDERATEFIKHYGGMQSPGKGWRKRLAKVLFDVPRSQMALIPFYARFTAILGQYFKDIPTELVNLLESEFTKLYEDSDVVKIESKIRNIRFLGELAKFGVCPAKTLLECLKKCLDDFNAHNIEITINLLDTCGKFLSRAPDESMGTTSAAAVLKFNNLLELLLRLKEKDNISSKSLGNLETAI